MALTSPESDVARSEKPQNAVAVIAPEPVLTCTVARTPESVTEPLPVSISSGTLSGTVSR